jgi:hypothetical protein
MTRCFLLFGLCCVSFVLLAADPVPSASEAPATELLLPSDDRPFVHFETGLRFPHTLGEFRLHSAFKDKRAELGLALTYLYPVGDMKATVLIYPNKLDMTNEKTVMGLVREEHTRLITDILSTAPSIGLHEKQRSPMEETLIPIWELGNLPMTMQTLDLEPVSNNKVLAKPMKAVNEWTGLTVYRDHWVHLTVLCPSDRMEANRKFMDQMITGVLACVREPSIVKEILLTCKHYVEQPLSVEGRKSADALLAYSKESPVFEVALPGEALTPMLNMITERSKEDALDLLRAFIVGSSVVSLQDGTVDQSLQEGARVLISVRDGLAKAGHDMRSEFLDDLAKAVKESRASALLKETMRTMVNVKPAPAK